MRQLRTESCTQKLYNGGELLAAFLFLFLAQTVHFQFSFRSIELLYLKYVFNKLNFYYFVNYNFVKYV